MRRTLLFLALGGLGGIAGGLGMRRRRSIEEVPAQLRSPMLWIPFAVTNDRVVRVARRAIAGATPVDPAVVVRTEAIPSHDGHPIRTLVYERSDRARPSGALIWIHGGGMVMGAPEMNNAKCSQFAAELDLMVIAPDYRLAPEHPYPIGLEDCAAALGWLHEHAESLGVDPERIAVGGESAGGGLAAALTQLAQDRRGPAIRFQVLQYPMLDDRTATRNRDALVWSNRSNAYAWGAYLGHPAGEIETRPWAVPARREDLSGLPPAWIGVGDADLFCEEDLEYAQRLEQAGVPCELHVEPGMYHGADELAAGSDAMQEFRARMVNALGNAINIADTARV